MIPMSSRIAMAVQAVCPAIEQVWVRQDRDPSYNGNEDRKWIDVIVLSNRNATEEEGDDLRDALADSVEGDNTVSHISFQMYPVDEPADLNGYELAQLPF